MKVAKWLEIESKILNWVWFVIQKNRKVVCLCWFLSLWRATLAKLDLRNQNKPLVTNPCFEGNTSSTWHRPKYCLVLKRCNVSDQFPFLLEYIGSKMWTSLVLILIEPELWELSNISNFQKKRTEITLETINGYKSGLGFDLKLDQMKISK